MLYTIVQVAGTLLSHVTWALLKLLVCIRQTLLASSVRLYELCRGKLCGASWMSCQPWQQYY